jgi:ketosteroid isomerase-like protein
MEVVMRSIALSMFLLIGSGAALGGPLDNAKIRERLEAIAAGSTDALMRDYDDAAQMQWIGGKFNGAYRGAGELRKLWGDFQAFQGPMKMTMGEVVSHGNPNGVTVLAKARYVGKLDVRVQHVFVLRDGRIMMEIWQIDPSISLGK